MTAIAKYTWIGYTSVRSNLAYVGEIAARTTFMATVLYVFMRLWTAVYAGAGVERLGGLTLSQMLWYLMMTEAIVLSAPRVSVEVDEDVRTGRVAVQLLRPMSYPLSLYGKAMGERIVRFVLNFLSGSIVALVLAGPIPISVRGLAMFVLALPLAFAVDFLGYFIVGLFAFWLESTIGIALLYSRLTMLLGGMLMPLEVFPIRWQPILRLLPFATVVYGPARMFVAPDAGLLLKMGCVQCASLGVFAAVAAVIQKIAVKRIQSNGG
jgi:viologen exporter family transport system permease protein